MKFPPGERAPAAGRGVLPRVTRSGLRVAFLTPEFLPQASGTGGLASYLQRMCRTLRSLGHDPEVFSLTEGDRGVTDFDGTRVTLVRPAGIARHAASTFDQMTVRAYLGGAISLAKALALRERTHAFDFIQSSDYGATGLFVRRSVKRPRLVRCSWAITEFLKVDGTLDPRTIWLLSRLERLSLRRCDAAYAPSEFVSNYYRQNHDLPLAVIRPPFQLDVPPAAAVPPGVPGRYLIHFGLLGRRKGTDLVATALPLAWKDEPDLAMVWAGLQIGPNVYDESRSLWGERARQVVWLGPLTKSVLYACLRRAVASVLPSRIDNLPNTVLESLLFQVPVIGSRGASIDEMVEPDRDGELVPIEDPDALAAAMVRAWRRERETAPGPRRLPRALDDMDPPTAANRLIDFALSGHV